MKSKKLIQFENDFNNIDKLKMFEIEVISKETKQTDYIIFDIAIEGLSFVAQHESLTTKQSGSKKISSISTRIDTDFSIYQNLEELYSACIDAICNSDFFDLL